MAFGISERGALALLDFASGDLSINKRQERTHGQMAERKSVGIGIIAIIAAVGVALSGNFDETWGIAVVVVGAVLAVLDELAARRPHYALAWVMSIGSVVGGAFIWEPWGALVGLVVGTLVASPIANVVDARRQ